MPPKHPKTPPPPPDPGPAAAAPARKQTRSSRKVSSGAGRRPDAEAGLRTAPAKTRSGRAGNTGSRQAGASARTTAKTTGRPAGIGLHTAEGLRKYLTAGERDSFLREAERADRAVRTLCRALAYAGCRLSEALALTADRVDLAVRKSWVNTAARTT